MEASHPNVVASPRRIMVAITGASGAIYGLRTLQMLRRFGVEIHLVVTLPARITIKHELGMSLAEVKSLADVVHPINDVGAPISSGSFQIMGMIIAPCSMKTLGEIAHGVGGTLVSRAADVVLKERRRLVLMARETPFHAIHLRNMLTLSEMGAIIAPPLPAFYSRPSSLDDLVDHSVARVLDLFGLDAGMKRWGGMQSDAAAKPSEQAESSTPLRTR